MARRGRKVTPTLVTESQALAHAAQQIVAVLHAWHPSSMPLTIAVQQLAAFAGDLQTLKPAENGPEES